MSLTITLRNISKLAPISDYHYEVFINARCIESGYVRGHDRSDGWDGLLLLLGGDREVTETYTPATQCTLLPTPTKKRARK